MRYFMPKHTVVVYRHDCGTIEASREIFVYILRRANRLDDTYLLGTNHLSDILLETLI